MEQVGQHESGLIKTLAQNEKSLKEMIRNLELQTQELPRLREKLRWMKDKRQSLMEGQLTFDGYFDFREMPQDEPDEASLLG